MNKKRYQLILNEDLESFLSQNNFSWSGPYRMFLHRWTVLKIPDFDFVYAELRLDPQTLICELDVYTAPKTYYGPFYQYLRGIADSKNPDLSRVLRRIKGEFHRLGVVEVKNEN